MIQFFLSGEKDLVLYQNKYSFNGKIAVFGIFVSRGI